ncbi:hypothetical protein QDA04_gp48 [Microbacterium phage Megan]|uniref:Uncharacterized protein n=1 Tax=Microbacterium phage Megan TaxID=2656551 RepID=A0A649VK72_9CAUD|nr:hypothetical protein QDA04_gp48 [Microbacterium phage Megan]QGJ92718.1 hypothetical protein PBI_MEGAN_48 [Microbacterium phage Megan]
MTGNGIPDTSAAGLPDGFTPDDVADHAVTLQMSSMLINATSAYLEAPTGEDGEAEANLDGLAQRLSASPEAAGRVLLCLASVLVATAPQEDVQAWFSEQAERVKEALGQ